MKDSLTLTAQIHISQNLDLEDDNDVGKNQGQWNKTKKFFKKFSGKTVPSAAMVKAKDDGKGRPGKAPPEVDRMSERDRGVEGQGEKDRDGRPKSVMDRKRPEKGVAKKPSPAPPGLSYVEEAIEQLKKSQLENEKILEKLNNAGQKPLDEKPSEWVSFNKRCNTFMSSAETVLMRGELMSEMLYKSFLLNPDNNSRPGSNATVSTSGGSNVQETIAVAHEASTSGFRRSSYPAVQALKLGMVQPASPAESRPDTGLGTTDLESSSNLNVVRTARSVTSLGLVSRLRAAKNINVDSMASTPLEASSHNSPAPGSPSSYQGVVFSDGLTTYGNGTDRRVSLDGEGDGGGDGPELSSRTTIPARSEGGPLQPPAGKTRGAGKRRPAPPGAKSFDEDYVTAAAAAGGRKRNAASEGNDGTSRGILSGGFGAITSKVATAWKGASVGKPLVPSVHGQNHIKRGGSVVAPSPRGGVSPSPNSITGGTVPGSASFDSNVSSAASVRFLNGPSGGGAGRGVSASPSSSLKGDNPSVATVSGGAATARRAPDPASGSSHRLLLSKMLQGTSRITVTASGVENPMPSLSAGEDPSQWATTSKPSASAGGTPDASGLRISRSFSGLSSVGLMDHPMSPASGEAGPGTQSNPQNPGALPMLSAPSAVWAVSSAKGRPPSQTALGLGAYAFSMPAQLARPPLAFEATTAPPLSFERVSGSSKATQNSGAVNGNGIAPRSNSRNWSGTMSSLHAAKEVTPGGYLNVRTVRPPPPGDMAGAQALHPTDGGPDNAPNANGVSFLSPLLRPASAVRKLVTTLTGRGSASSSAGTAGAGAAQNPGGGFVPLSPEISSGSYSSGLGRGCGEIIASPPARLVEDSASLPAQVLPKPTDPAQLKIWEQQQQQAFRYQQQWRAKERHEALPDGLDKDLGDDAVGGSLEEEGEEEDIDTEAVPRSVGASRLIGSRAPVTVDVSVKGGAASSNMLPSRSSNMGTQLFAAAPSYRDDKTKKSLSSSIPSHAATGTTPGGDPASPRRRSADLKPSGSVRHRTEVFLPGDLFEAKSGVGGGLPASSGSNVSVQGPAFITGAPTAVFAAVKPLASSEDDEDFSPPHASIDREAGAVPRLGSGERTNGPKDHSPGPLCAEGSMSGAVCAADLGSITPRLLTTHSTRSREPFWPVAPLSHAASYPTHSPTSLSSSTTPTPQRVISEPGKESVPQYHEVTGIHAPRAFASSNSSERKPSSSGAGVMHVASGGEELSAQGSLQSSPDTLAVHWPPHTAAPPNSTFHSGGTSTSLGFEAMLGQAPYDSGSGSAGPGSWALGHGYMNAVGQMAEVAAAGNGNATMGMPARAAGQGGVDTKVAGSVARGETRNPSPSINRKIMGPLNVAVKLPPNLNNGQSASPQTLVSRFSGSPMHPPAPPMTVINRHSSSVHNIRVGASTNNSGGASLVGGRPASTSGYPPPQRTSMNGKALAPTPSAAGASPRAGASIGARLKSGAGGPLVPSGDWRAPSGMPMSRGLSVSDLSNAAGQVINPSLLFSAAKDNFYDAGEDDDNDNGMDFGDVVETGRVSLHLPPAPGHDNLHAATLNLPGMPISGQISWSNGQPVAPSTGQMPSAADGAISSSFAEEERIHGSNGHRSEQLHCERSSPSELLIRTSVEAARKATAAHASRAGDQGLLLHPSFNMATTTDNTNSRSSSLVQPFLSPASSSGMIPDVLGFSPLRNGTQSNLTDGSLYSLPATEAAAAVGVIIPAVRPGSTSSIGPAAAVAKGHPILVSGTKLASYASDDVAKDVGRVSGFAPHLDSPRGNSSSQVGQHGLLEPSRPVLANRVEKCVTYYNRLV